MKQELCAVSPFAVSVLDLAGELVALATSMFRGTTGEAEALVRVTAAAVRLRATLEDYKAALSAPAHPETLAKGRPTP